MRISERVVSRPKARPTCDPDPHPCWGQRSMLEPAPKPIAQVAESATGDVEAKWNLVQPRGKATKKSNTGAHSLDKT